MAMVNTAQSRLLFIAVIVFAGFLHFSEAKPRHIIFMHGILSNPKTEALQLKQWVAKYLPGTTVTAIDKFDNSKSLTDMWTQVNTLVPMFQNITSQHPEGVNLICFSQGGLVCRGLLSVVHHNVKNFISLSCPQAGQFGDTDYLRKLFPHFLRNNIYKYFYTPKGQHWSVGNYWHDPHHEDMYVNQSMFLAKLDGDRMTPQLSTYKKNFLLLENLILIGGPDDGVITPWQSSQFGFFDEKENIVEMHKQKFYLDDLFGLQTLDKRKAIHNFTIPNVKHVHWYRNLTVFENYILPWLK